MPEQETGLWYANATLAATPPKGDGPIEFTASTEAVNRNGYSLRNDGWRLENFQRNPVVLWMHIPFRAPIGRAAARLENGDLRAAVTFDMGDPFAAEIDRKYRNGFLSAVSVGFDPVDEDGVPLDGWSLKPEQIRDEAFYDLAEISAVSVPADAGAVKRSLAMAREALGLLDTDLQPVGEALTLERFTRDEVAALVDEQLARFGVNPTDLAAALQRLAAAPTPEPTPEPVGITRHAAQAVLAALAPKEGDTQ